MDTKATIKLIIQEHDDHKLSDHEAADLLKRLIEQYFREEEY